MKTDDADFELSVSNNIQKLSLYHKDSLYKPFYENPVSNSIGVIFINTHSKGFKYAKNHAERDYEAIKEQIHQTEGLFDILHIPKQNVRIFYDKSKAEIVEQFQSLQKEALKSRANRKGVLAIIVRWIGWDFNLGHYVQTVKFPRLPQDGVPTKF